MNHQRAGETTQSESPPNIPVVLSPDAVEAAAPEETETLVTSPPTVEAEGVVLAEEDLPPLDPSDIVEEAEQLLREGAPHDFDVLVIGGGPGGYVAAIRAAQLGAHVGLIEERELGGVCINRGCIPTKALLESIDVMRLMRRAQEYGISLSGEFKADFHAMNTRKNEVVAQLRTGVAELLDENKVEVIQGRARFVGEHTVEVTPTGASDAAPRSLTAVHIIIATGSVPQRLPVPGNDLPGVITSDEILELEGVPERLVAVGAGAVGIEFAYLFHEMGTRSTLLEMAPTILPQEDPDIAREMERLLLSYGMDVWTSTRVDRIERDGDNLQVVFFQGGFEWKLKTSLVLMASGRRANTDALNLDEAGIKHEDGRITVDEHCETSVSGVYAIGDCIRNVGWAHIASGEGTMVAEIVTDHPITVDLAHIPSCYYTHPEMATVGQTAEGAEKAGITPRVGVFHFRANGKAAAAGEHDGFVKVVVDDATDRLIGCQIIGPRATDIISEAVLALKTKQTVEELVGAIHAHPTFSEALPEAALAARKRPPLVQ